jgi:hypothetical protein
MAAAIMTKGSGEIIILASLSTLRIFAFGANKSVNEPLERQTLKEEEAKILDYKGDPLESPLYN